MFTRPPYFSLSNFPQVIFLFYIQMTDKFIFPVQIPLFSSRLAYPAASFGSLHGCQHIQNGAHDLPSQTSSFFSLLSLLSGNSIIIYSLLQVRRLGVMLEPSPFRIPYIRRPLTPAGFTSQAALLLTVFLYLYHYNASPDFRYLSLRTEVPLLWRGGKNGSCKGNQHCPLLVG